jgi:hypothetical protein
MFSQPRYDLIINSEFGSPQSFRQVRSTSSQSLNECLRWKLPAQSEFRALHTFVIKFQRMPAFECLSFVQFQHQSKRINMIEA